MVLKPAKVDKALVLGDAMAMIEVINEVRGYTLSNIYIAPEKMIKLHHSTSKISQQWLSRLKSMKTSKYFNLKVIRDLTENKNLAYLKEVLYNVDVPVTEEEIELGKFLHFFYQLDCSEFSEFITEVYYHYSDRVVKYRTEVDKELQTPITK